MINETIFMHVQDEIERAKKLHPTNKHRFAALIEEQGEFAQAWLNHEENKCSRNDLYFEAIQSIAMLLRLLTESDSNFKFEPITLEDLI